MVPEIGGAFFQPMVRGIEAGARELGFDLLIHTTRMSRPDNTPWRRLAEHNTDGLLVFTDGLGTAEMARLQSIGFPVVLLHRTPPKALAISCVTIENQAGARNIIDHLITIHGHRRIAILQGQVENEDSMWREKGYREALDAHGLPFDPSLVARGGFDQEESMDAVQRWLAGNVAFDAIFASDDSSAVGAILALRQAGKRVPEDIAVVGFDDSQLARSVIPPLTTVRAPTEQVGLEGVRQLVKLIHGEQAEARVTLPTKLVIRQSCGCQDSNSQG